MGIYICNCECNKACKIDKYLDIKNCLCKKRLIVKLVLACENKILNRTKTLLHKKVTYEKKFLFHTISQINICALLLAVISIGCHYFWPRYWKKPKHLLSYCDINNKLKEVNINSIIQNE